MSFSYWFLKAKSEQMKENKNKWFLYAPCYFRTLDIIVRLEKYNLNDKYLNPLTDEDVQKCTRFKYFDKYEKKYIKNDQFNKLLFKLCFELVQFYYPWASKKNQEHIKYLKSILIKPYKEKINYLILNYKPMRTTAKDIKRMMIRLGYYLNIYESQFKPKTIKAIYNYFTSSSLNKYTHPGCQFPVFRQSLAFASSHVICLVITSRASCGALWAIIPIVLP